MHHGIRDPVRAVATFVAGPLAFGIEIRFVVGWKAFDLALIEIRLEGIAVFRRDPQGHGLLAHEQEVPQLNLVGNFGFRLAHGQVGVLGWIWRFLYRKWLGVGGTAEFVFGEMTVGIHSIVMPEASQRKPSISCSGEE